MEAVYQVERLSHDRWLVEDPWARKERVVNSELRAHLIGIGWFFWWR